MFPCDFGSFGFMSFPGDSVVAGRFRRRFGGTFDSVSMWLFYTVLRENQVGKIFSRVLSSGDFADFVAYRIWRFNGWQIIIC